MRSRTEPKQREAVGDASRKGLPVRGNAYLRVGRRAGRSNVCFLRKGSDLQKGAGAGKMEAMLTRQDEVGVWRQRHVVRKCSIPIFRFRFRSGQGGGGKVKGPLVIGRMSLETKLITRNQS